MSNSALRIVSISVLLMIPTNTLTLRSQSVRTGLIDLVVTVTDSDQRFVKGLTQRDFKVTIDGVEQSIMAARLDDDSPISVGLLIDTSLSMKPPKEPDGLQTAIDAIGRAGSGKPATPHERLEAARDAARSFIHAMRPDDEFLLMTFAREFDVRQKFTQDRDRIDKALAKITKITPGTQLFQAVLKAARQTGQGKHRKRTVIVISDGGDTSGLAFNPAVRSSVVEKFKVGLRASEVLMYAIQVQGFESEVAFTPRAKPTRFETYKDRMSTAEHGPIREPRVPLAGINPADAPPGVLEPPIEFRSAVMDSIASQTGGLHFVINGQLPKDDLFKQYSEIFEKVSTELRSQYQITIALPSSEQFNLSRIRVRTFDPSHKVRIGR